MEGRGATLATWAFCVTAVNISSSIRTENKSITISFNQFPTKLDPIANEPKLLVTFLFD